MNREEALALLEENLKTVNLVRHCIAVEAAMRRVSGHLGEDVDLWGLAGLLHDIDLDIVQADPKRHGLVGAEILERAGLPEEVLHAVRSHAGHRSLESKLDTALFAVDPATGLIVASALMHPEKRLKPLDAGFVMRRFAEKRFARGARREDIMICERLEIPLEEFIELVLSGMKGVAEEIGL